MTGKKKRRPPVPYTRELADDICSKLSDGTSLRELCRDEGMPNESTVRDWATTDVDGFGARYVRAREVGYLAMADELLEIADDSSGDMTVDENGKERMDSEFAARSRLRVDTRKWFLAKMLPKVFGDRIDMNHSGTVNVEMADALRKARERLAGQDQADG